MSAATRDPSYIDRVRDSLPQDHPLCNNNLASAQQHQRVVYARLDGSAILAPSLPHLLQLHQETEVNRQFAVCLVENICQEWIIGLGTAWSISHTFFSRHASNPEGDSIWEALMKRDGKWDSVNPDDATIHASAHMNGIFEHLEEDRSRPQKDRFPRRLQRHPVWGLQSNSKISYYRVSPYLYLVLTDLPYTLSSNSLVRENYLLTHLCFRVPFSRNRGGHAIPQHYDRPGFAAMDIFGDFLKHTWHFRVLFSEHLKSGAIHPGILSNLLAASMWRTNFQSLKREIESIAFKDVRRPSILINDRLHDARQKLASLQAEVRFARNYMRSDDLDAFLQQIQNMQQKLPRDALDQVLEEAERLYQFLMDTFQLLMGSISVLDSQTSLEEAKRSTTLTQLAAVYLPLSLATGIFGMNVKEINDSPLSVWVVFVALAILAVGTVVLLLGATTIRFASIDELRTWTKYLPHSRKRPAAQRGTALEGQLVESGKYD